MGTMYLNADNDLDRLLSGMPLEPVRPRNSLYLPHRALQVHYGPITAVFYHDTCEACASEHHHYAYTYRNRLDGEAVLEQVMCGSNDIAAGITNIERKEVIKSTVPVCWRCCKAKELQQ